MQLNDNNTAIPESGYSAASCIFLQQQVSAGGHLLSENERIQDNRWWKQ
ncbi:hypothetical protein [Chitinophaga solisilvae]|uniref:Uncharacterized protein n=1 Tax=Chitinophaga solisilvae TaxID=1233460 RepID=A0A9Q5GR35_9BACT|nr:hypothetical protein [Chitinophaga solisilvae]NSL87847.1 hypothetical protein [Chitinophaga solisilvae]